MSWERSGVCESGRPWNPKTGRNPAARPSTQVRPYTAQRRMGVARQAGARRLYRALDYPFTTQTPVISR